MSFLKLDYFLTGSQCDTPHFFVHPGLLNLTVADLDTLVVSLEADKVYSLRFQYLTRLVVERLFG